MFGKKKLQVVDSNDCASCGDAVEGAMNYFEENKLEGKEGEPDITVVIRSNKTNADGFRNYDCHAYIGATKEEVLNDLKDKL